MERPMDILGKFPVRKTKAQKGAFRAEVCAYAASLGYAVTEEAGALGCRNLIIGDPKTAKYLITAHYDTCARLPFPNLITPCNFWTFLACQVGQFLMIGMIPFLIGMLGGWLGWSDLGIHLAVDGVLLAVLALLLVGPANQNNANDNTSGVVTLLEIARTLPENQRHKVCFVLFDLEEAGLIGSASYRKRHRAETDGQLVLNLDCVGEGDYLRFFPTKALKKDKARLSRLNLACGYFGKKNLLIHSKGFAIYPSDQMNFPYGVGICALNKGKFGLYLGKIHTPADRVLDETNVNILRAALTNFICRDAV